MVGHHFHSLLKRGDLDFGFWLRDLRWAGVHDLHGRDAACAPGLRGRVWSLVGCLVSRCLCYTPRVHLRDLNTISLAPCSENYVVYGRHSCSTTLLCLKAVRNNLTILVVTGLARWRDTHQRPKAAVQASDAKYIFGRILAMKNACGLQRVGKKQVPRE